MQNESELYTLWEQSARPGSSFVTRSGERVTVVSAGRRNMGAGPDYPGAVLLVDGHLRIGAVEMHLSEGDWFAHGHQDDPAYDGVVLHVLARDDGGCRLPIPTIDADDLMPEREIASGIAARSDVSPALLAELSWERLLRRTTATLRQIGADDADADLESLLLTLIFDGLGYSGNRSPMRRVAAELVRRRDQMRPMSFEELAAMVFAIAGLDRVRLRAVGEGFVPDERLERMLPPIGGALGGDWIGGTRPANAPERRIWGGARLLYELYRNRLFDRLVRAVSSGKRIDGLVDLLAVRFGNEVVVGRGRASEIALNGVLPVLLAAGLRTGNVELIEGVCRSYRNAPAQGTNRHLKLFRQRYAIDLDQRGAFWQQGGIELIQRYHSSDRAALSFVAEPRPGSARKTQPTLPYRRCT